MMQIGSGLVPVDSPAYSADYRARINAAGLDGDWDGVDIDEARGRMVRMIHMYMNEWTGCPEAICRRMRGCMAPDEWCANVPEPSEEELDAGWEETLVDVRRALDEVAAERAGETQDAPFVAEKARTRR